MFLFALYKQENQNKLTSHEVTSVRSGLKLYIASLKQLLHDKLSAAVPLFQISFQLFLHTSYMPQWFILLLTLTWKHRVLLIYHPNIASHLIPGFLSQEIKLTSIH